VDRFDLPERARDMRGICRDSDDALSESLATTARRTGRPLPWRAGRRAEGRPGRCAGAPAEPLREVLFLRFYNEMSYRQMAQVLGATERVIDAASAGQEEDGRP
jgi:hypothetical protein